MADSERYATHREVELLETLRDVGGTARTTNLAEALKVSEETVRRTIKALAKTGAVRRVHGGVYLVNAHAGKPVSSRLSHRAPENRASPKPPPRWSRTGPACFWMWARPPRMWPSPCASTAT